MVASYKSIRGATCQNDCEYLIIFRHKVRVGASRRSQRRGFEELNVINVIQHEEFNIGSTFESPTYINDIGLLKLEKNVKQGVKNTCQVTFTYLYIHI